MLGQTLRLRSPLKKSFFAWHPHYRRGRGHKTTRMEGAEGKEMRAKEANSSECFFEKATMDVKALRELMGDEHSGITEDDRKTTDVDVAPERSCHKCVQCVKRIS